MASTYERGFSFAGFQANRPATPLPGQQVDIELDRVAHSVAVIRAALIAGGIGDDISLEWGDIQNKPTFGTAAGRDVGALRGTVAAGDDPRIVGALQASRNGSDIPDKSLFRGMLELGPAALLGVGMEAGTVAAGDDFRFTLLAHDIRWYGAKMDGVTDDTVAWQRMADAEGRVIVPPGATVLNGRVGSLTNARGVYYQGAGTARTTVLLGPSGGLNVSGRNWSVDGFKFQANGVVACALRTGTVENNRGWCITNNEWTTPSTNASVNAGDAAKYFQIGLELNSCWFGRAVNNELFNWGSSFEQFRGTAVTWSSSVNNYFAFNSIVNWGEGYVWESRQAASGVNNEGHQIVGNVFVANRRNMLFTTGILPTVIGNVIDLTKNDGTVLESYVTCLVLKGNWFATQAGGSAGLAIYGGDSHVIEGNTFAWNDANGVQLSIQNIRYASIANNTFRFGAQGLAANAGCSNLSVTGNTFVGQGAVSVNLSNVTGKLAYSGNVAAGSEVLPSTVNQGIVGAGSGSSQPTTRNPYVATQVFTTGQNSMTQEVTFNVPGGVFSDRPASVSVELGGDLGYAANTYYKYDQSSATSIVVGIRRSDGNVIPSGSGIRIGIVA